MGVYQILCLVGVPTIVGALWGYMFAKVKAFKKDLNALKLGTQAMLRNELIALYQKYYKDGIAPTYVKDNFENMYKQYHSLGANGVMDSYYEQFMDLPS